MIQIIQKLATLIFTNIQFSYKDAKDAWNTVDVNDDSSPQAIFDGLNECDSFNIFLDPGVSSDQAVELLTELKAFSAESDKMNEFKGRVKVSTNKNNSGTTVSLGRESVVGIYDGSALANALELLIS